MNVQNAVHATLIACALSLSLSAAVDAQQSTSSPAAYPAAGAQPSSAMPSGTRTPDEGGATGGRSAHASEGMAGGSKSTRDFVSHAAMDGLLEVQVGKLAESKSQDPTIKRFAEQMVRDHSQANDELMKLAQAKGLQVPTELDAKHQAKLDKLRGLDGAKFDRAYSKDMKQDHARDVKMFQHEAQSASDPDIKSFAAKTLGTLKDHQHMAQSLPAANRG